MCCDNFKVKASDPTLLSNAGATYENAPQRTNPTPLALWMDFLAEGALLASEEPPDCHQLGSLSEFRPLHDLGRNFPNGQSVAFALDEIKSSKAEPSFLHREVL